ncbi:hypothetical protein WJX72_006878 [[Myrmecia] bisecta]|uniref:G8 domain-containing protein n=1 Tax=[Myrmecia] bisecta TaxID=41462 RepID=A0AAW1R7I7_9CHLO
MLLSLAQAAAADPTALTALQPHSAAAGDTVLAELLPGSNGTGQQPHLRLDASSVQTQPRERNTLYVTAPNGQLYMFKYHPAIRSMSQSQGSLAGGMHITITGSSFIPWRGSGHFSVAVFAQRDSDAAEPAPLATEPTSPQWFLAPIPSDYLSTPHISPQLRVSVNGVRAFCQAAAGDCSFTPSDAVTPAITGLRVSDALESGARNLVISGFEFAQQKLNNTVTVADQVGTGFGNDPDQISIMVGGKSAPLVAVSPTSATFTVPPLSAVGLAPAAQPTAVSGVLTVNGVEAVFDVLYSMDVTPQANAGQLSHASAADAAELVISGSGFAVQNQVFVGDQACDVQQANGTAIVCMVGPSAPGLFPVTVNVAGKGLALGGLRVERQFSLNSVTPLAGSSQGGTMLNITGQGFPTSAFRPVTVSFLGLPSMTCDVTQRTATQLTTALTPTLDAVEVAVLPDNSTQLLLRGTGLADTPDSILMALLDGDATQLATTVTATSSQAAAQVSQVPAGTYAVQAFVIGKGFAVGAANFTLQANASLDSVDPPAGSLFGGLPVNIRGSGFDGKFLGRNSVTICGAACVVLSASFNRLTCISGPLPGAAGANATLCDVVAKVAGQQAVLPSAFTYSADLTPHVMSAEPSFGPSAGDTVVKLSGQGFLPQQPPSSGTAVIDVDFLQMSVRIGGVPCQVFAGNDTWAQCLTPPKSPAWDPSLGITLQVARSGFAEMESAPFTYLDRWSEPTTWPDGVLPRMGDVVVIGADQGVLLDVSPPPLGSLRIEGRLVFEDAQDLSLQACSVLVLGSNASLAVGTASQPFTHSVNITLGGGCSRAAGLQDPQAGGLVVAGGRLELYGQPKIPSWTKLASAASAGATQLQLATEVNWQAHDTIIITSTTSEADQAELLTITQAVGRAITFVPALQFDHGADVLDLNGTTLDLRAEVAVLSRNLRVFGASSGGDTAAGAYIGVYGAAGSAAGAAAVKLSHTEVANCGQAGLSGQPCVMLASIDEESQSFMAGCSIHDSANEGLAIVGLPGFQVQDTVVVSTAGHAFSVTGVSGSSSSKLADNLAVLARNSSLNSYADTLPAAFYLSGAAMELRGNIAAGSAAHGFLLELSAGGRGDLSTDQPNAGNCPFGTGTQQLMFEGNTAHSNALDGLHIVSSLQRRHPTHGRYLTGPEALLPDDVFRTKPSNETDLNVLLVSQPDRLPSPPYPPAPTATATWGNVCQLPISLALFVADNAVADASGTLNAFSNILYVSWYPPLSPACQDTSGVPLRPPPPPASAAATLAFNVVLPNLDIAQLQDAMFETTFTSSYRQQIASAAGVPVAAVAVLGITAGSVVVQTLVTFPQSAQAPLALQTFQQTLVNTPAQIFTDPQFSSTYGTPQTAILAIDTPPPPPPTPAQVPPPGPMEASAPAPNPAVIPVAAPAESPSTLGKTVGIALGGVLGGLSLVTLACVAGLWLVRMRQKRAQDAQEEAEMAEAASSPTPPDPEASRRIRSLIRTGSRKVWNSMTKRVESPKANTNGAMLGLTADGRVTAIPEEQEEIDLKMHVRNAV